MKNARAKRAKILFSIVKYANLRGFCCRLRRGCLSSLLLLQPSFPHAWLQLSAFLFVGWGIRFGFVNEKVMRLKISLHPSQ